MKIPKKTGQIILMMLMLSLALAAGAQTKNSADDSTAKLTFTNDQFSDIQKTLDERTAKGFRVSAISYRTKLTNLYTRGRLEISLKADDPNAKYECRALITDSRTSNLERQMNDAGKKGFRLFRQTPIPLESGFFRSQDMFIAIMEKSGETSKKYQYLILSYRTRIFVRKRIEQAEKDGYVKQRESQLGRITYLVLEKETD